MAEIVKWALIALLVGNALLVLANISYWLRPYDMLLDARRWRWQPSPCCRCGRRHL